MFCDQVFITVKAGDGGNGCASFRREKYVAHGPPDGGNGGEGGAIVFKVDGNLNSLFHFRGRKRYVAESGRPGHRFDKAGRKGEDLILSVPPGTQVYDESQKEFLVDLVEDGAEFVLLKGGRGGHGNAHFMSSVRQAPDFAELGEPGQSLDLRLEMNLVADVGIIGLPSVGKSTLISRISNAKPKIAAYHFTTLIPNMGMVELGAWGGSPEQTFVVADIPGLIEGAHEGKGLGHEFLRHVSRTAILVHVLDVHSADMRADYDVIIKELAAYDPELAKRPQLIVLNKVDSIDDETQDMLLTEFKASFEEDFEAPIFSISAVAGTGLKSLIYALWEKVQERREQQPASSSTKTVDEGYRVFRPHLKVDPRSFRIEESSFEDDEGHSRKRFTVSGKRIEQIVVMTDLENRSAVYRIYDVMEKMGIAQELRRRNAQLGDRIRIGEADLDFRG